MELVLGTKKVGCQVYGRFERSTYLAMSQDPVVPLNVSTPTPQDATPLANKNVTNFLWDSVAIRSKPMEVCIIWAATLPRGDVSANAEGFPGPAKLLCQIWDRFSLYIGVKYVNFALKNPLTFVFTVLFH
jgi:hypothetical protein